METRSERLLWVDCIRIFAIILVVLLHVSDGYIYQVNSSTSWWVANFFDSIARPGVPLFIMISGMLLLDNRDSIKTFYFKRIRKIFIPYIFWSVIYILWYALLTNEPIKLFASMKKIFTFSSSFHLLFFNYLIALYLIVPFLSEVMSKVNELRTKYFLILWFIFIPINVTLIKLFNFHISIDPEMFTNFIGLFILGYYLKTSKTINLSKNFIIYLFSLVFTIYITYNLSIKNNKLDEFFYNYHTPNVVFMSWFIFNLIKQTAVQTFKLKIFRNSIKQIIIILSDLSFGIFLVHIMLMTLFDKIGFLNFVLEGDSLILFLIIPLKALIILLCSCLIVYFIKKIPYLKMIV